MSLSDLSPEDRAWVFSLPGPCYYHLRTRTFDGPRGVHSWRALQLAKGRLKKRVVAAGGNPEEIAYIAGIGPILRKTLSTPEDRFHRAMVDF